VSSRDPIEEARTAATKALLGHRGIVGVGRTERSIVLFVSDRRAAREALHEWPHDPDPPIELRDVARFRPAR
jgi:hypothetical protein